MNLRLVTRTGRQKAAHIHACAERERHDGPHPCHICAGTGLTPATSAPGLGSPRATSALGLGSPPTHICRARPNRHTMGAALAVRRRMCNSDAHCMPHAPCTYAVPTNVATAWWRRQGCYSIAAHCTGIPLECLAEVYASAAARGVVLGAAALRQRASMQHVIKTCGIARTPPSHHAVQPPPASVPHGMKQCDF